MIRMFPSLFQSIGYNLHHHEQKGAKRSKRFGSSFHSSLLRDPRLGDSLKHHTDQAIFDGMLLSWCHGSSSRDYFDVFHVFGCQHL